jgi:ABC-type antimicrobial peptide transport system ATPase subunit
MLQSVLFPWTTMWNHPRLLILDEPSNHLDMDSVDLRDIFTHKSDIINEHCALSFLSGTYSNELTDKEVPSLSTQLDTSIATADLKRFGLVMDIFPVQSITI